MNVFMIKLKNIQTKFTLYNFHPGVKFDVVVSLSVMKESECENAPTDETEDDDEDGTSRREGGGLEQVEAPLPHDQPSEFSIEPQSSPGEEGSPLEGNTDRLAAGG